MNPQDSQLTEELEPSTDRVCRRWSKLAYLAIIGTSVGVVMVLDVVRQHLPNINVWLLALAVPIWFMIHLWRKYSRSGSGNPRSGPGNLDS
jgi:hypothetical protein